MTGLPREGQVNDDTVDAPHELGQLMAVSSFGSNEAGEASTSAPSMLSHTIAERILRRLGQNRAESPSDPGSSAALDAGGLPDPVSRRREDALGFSSRTSGSDPVLLADRSAPAMSPGETSTAGDRGRTSHSGKTALDLQSLVCKLRVGDPSARETALEVSRTAINRYCRALALLETVSHDQAQSAAEYAVTAVHTWLDACPDVNVGSFLAYVHKAADEAIRQAREGWGLRWFSRQPSCGRRDRISIIFEPRKLKDLIGALPDIERTVVVLRAMVGCSVAVTAEVISVQPRTVHYLQFKALSRLAGNLAREVEATECQSNVVVDEISEELSQLTSVMAGRRLSSIVPEA